MPCWLWWRKNEELREAWEQLSLNNAKREGIEVRIRDEKDSRGMEERSLIGKICMDRCIGKEVI